MISFFAWGCSDAGLKTVNADPTVSILSPSDGDSVTEVVPQMLRGQVGDTNNALADLSVTWLVDDETVCPDSAPDDDGVVTCEVAFDLDGGAVQLEVRDPDGASAVASINLVVEEAVEPPPNTAPTVTITAPEDGDTVNSEAVVTFTATVGDEQDDPTDLALEWAMNGEVMSTDGADSTGTASFTLDGKGTDINFDSGPHTFTLTATDSEGLFVTDTITLNANEPPTAPSVSINPDPAVTTDNLIAVASGSEDPEESGSVTYRYVWFADGIEDTDITGSEYPSDHTVKGHTYSVDVYPNDGLQDGEPGTAERVVINSAPEIDSISVSPESGPVGTIVECAATAIDVDEDTVTITYAWSDGSEGSNFTIPESAAAGDTFTCTATADDGDGGTDTATADVTVTNTGPVMTSVIISPDDPTNDATLTCEANATDADGESPVMTYAWSTGDTEPIIILASTLTPGDIVTCTATATDASGETDTGNDSVTIINRSPVIGSVSIAPDSPTASDSLECTATGIIDPDGEAVTVDYAWDINDLPAGTGTELSGDYAKGDEVTCTASATDASGSTTTANATVTIGNTRPNVSAIALSPAELYTHDTLTAVPTVSDADGDALTVTYAFSVNGELVQDGEIASLSGIVHFDKHDIISLVVTVDDGEGFDTRSADSVTVLNTPPTAPEVSIQTATCAEGWTPLEDGERCVAVFEGPDHTWSEAEAECVSMGGHLVRIASESDNETVYGLAIDIPDESIWLGYNERESEGTWVWSDGGPTDYENWREDEPGGGFPTTDEDCVALLHTHLAPPEYAGTWVDENCETAGWVGGYACQTSLDNGDLVCTIDDASTDDDGDTLTYTIEWDVDGEAYTDTESTTLDGDTVPGDALGSDEVWTCEVTANDGEDWGAPGEASITLDDTAAWVSPTTDMRMVLIPGGTFDMGCTDEMDIDGHCNWYEFPVHTVTISNDYLVGITEVTQGQWEAVMGSNPSTAIDCGGDCPVETVSWNEAVEFANTLSTLDGLEPVYTIGAAVNWDRTANGYRLLTEAEWEFAARADDGTTYAGSDAVSEVAWTNDTAGSTQPVAGLMPNGHGLYDMSGNVFELCWDWHSTDYYSESPTFDPTGPDGPLVDRVARGGAYAYGVEHARISDRNRRDTPISRWNFTGLRLARTVESTYAWTHVGTEEVEMIYGSCTSIEASSAVCDASTVGEPIYINPTGADNLERKTLGETHLGLTGARGSSIFFSSDGTEATWQGATGCGGDYIQTDTVDIYRCLPE